VRPICLWGELGSGKTTFVQGLARGLGIPSRLLSPTFIIVRRYEIPQTKNFLYHVDLYRIKGPEDIVSLGFADMTHEPGSLTVIEWPERLGTLLPEHRIDIRFTVLSDGKHAIESKLL
jgi:tRNA threonylcarbamoyladenosine biosynthesis protein TsaE